MSKPKLVVSSTVALATLVAAGWWANKTLRLMGPPAYSTQMIAYGVAQQIEAGRPIAVSLHLADGNHAPRPDQIKGPVPVSMATAPYTLLAKKNKVKGDLIALLIVDASGSVAGVTEVTGHYFGRADPELANRVLNTAQTWKFKPATKQGEPIPAMVIVQVKF
jgi:hypothetical protein